MPFEDPGDDGPSHPVPDPLDRLWVHPSELAARPVSTPRSDRGARDWGLVLAAGATGALVTVGVLLLVGALGSGSTASGGRVAAMPVAALAAQAAPGVVGVVTASASGARRGSGIALGDGWVLTTWRKVASAGAVTVTGADGHSRAADVRGLDPETDLALLRVDGLAGGLAASDRAGVRVGESVVAVGAGNGTRGWVAAGVVSSVAAVVATGNTAQAGLIATDALVAEDAPGGALLDGEGRLVGVLTSGSGGGGVAVPIRMARDVASQLRLRGRAGHGWLGVSGGDAGERPGGGVHVDSVTPESPAANAGLAPGDVITAIDGRSTPRMIDLMGAVRRLHPGEHLQLALWRSGTTRTIDLAVGDAPSADPAGADAGTTPANAPTIAAGSPE